MVYAVLLVLVRFYKAKWDMLCSKCQCGFIKAKWDFDCTIFFLESMLIEFFFFFFFNVNFVAYIASPYTQPWKLCSKHHIHIILKQSNRNLKTRLHNSIKIMFLTQDFNLLSAHILYRLVYNYQCSLKYIYIYIYINVCVPHQAQQSSRDLFLYLIVLRACLVDCNSCYNVIIILIIQLFFNLVIFLL